MNTNFHSTQTRVVPPSWRCTLGRRRRGISIVEGTVALLVLGVAASLLGELLALGNRWQRGIAQQTIAAQEAANAWEHVRLRPWNELGDEQLASIKLSAAAARLPDATLTVKGIDEDQPVLGRRFDVRVEWTDLDGESKRSVALSGWRFAP